MNAQFLLRGYTAAEQLKDYIEKKLDKLAAFFDIIIEVDGYLKLESYHQVKVKRLEIKLNVPSVSSFSSESSKTFGAAINLAVDSLRKQLKKCKEKYKLNY